VKLADAGPALAWQPQAVQTRGIPWATHGPEFTRLLCWPIMPFVGPPQGYYFLAQIPRFLLFDGAARITYEYLYNKTLAEGNIPEDRHFFSSSLTLQFS
jgi:hypothetical protein